jgi:transmembrane sensor
MTDNPRYPAPTDQDAIAEQAMTWFVRLRAESVTPVERLQFQVWCRTNPAHRQAYQETSAFWDDSDFNAALGTAALSPPKQLPARRQAGIGRLARPLSAIAAGIALVAIIYRPTLSCWQADYCTGIGEIKTVQLADGSRVTLNSASAISVDWRNGQRHIQLMHGEALFDVQRDPQHPFIVDAHYSNTKVLGTQFVVREDLLGDSVSVVSGVVEVSRNRQNPTILKANDSITVDTERSSEIRRTPPNSATAWLKGSASFDNAPLSEVIVELSRYRRGSLLIADDALKNLKVSGRFDIANTDKALAALQQTLPIRVYTITPWLVVIS